MKTYKTHALGFPITILNPTFKVRAGQKTLDLSLEMLSKLAFDAVIKKPGRLTGGEIKFIRGFLGQNQSEFGDLMGLKGHSQVSKWEKKPEETTKMSVHQEYTIRILALRMINQKPTVEVIDMFASLKEEVEAGEYIEIDAEDVA